MQATTGDDDLDARVRRRLRERRAELGLTLQQVAEKANIDVSTLSRLEAGKRRLALDHLPALARALGVTSDHLIGPAAPVDPRVRQPARRHDGITVTPLTSRPGSSGLQTVKMVVSARRRVPPKVLPTHEGQEWLYVISGRLRLLLGELDTTIEPGEAAEFSTLEPHWFGAVDGPVELIGIFGPQGERIHLHG